MNNHTSIDGRSLAFGRAIAARLRDDPALVSRALTTLARWLETCSAQVRPALLEWRTVLEGAPTDIEALLTDSSERAVRMRQSNPFAGVLSQAERLVILRQYAANDTAST